MLEAIRQSDGIILGTPNYMSDVSAAFRTLFERLLFQYITYQREQWNYNTHPVPVLFIMTSNSPKEFYSSGLYHQMIEGYRNSFNGLIGPTKVMISGNTLQVSDYSRFNWTNFDPATKQAHHDEVFPIELEKAFGLGREIVVNPWTK